MNHHFDAPTRWGTCGGTLLVTLLQLSPAQVAETVVLAAIGAAVSFGVSLALRRLTSRRKM